MKLNIKSLNKFEKLLIFCSILIVISLILTSLYCLTNSLTCDVSLYTSTDKIVFYKTQPSIDLNITLANNSYNYITKGDNVFLNFQFIDNNNNIILEKKLDDPIILPWLTSKKYTLPIKAPDLGGNYTLKIFLDSELKESPLHTPIQIASSCLEHEYINGEAIGLKSSLVKPSIFANTELAVPLEISNYSSLNLECDKMYFISYHIYDDENYLLQWDGKRFNLSDTIKPFEVLNQTISIQDPIFSKAGTYNVVIDIVHEGVSWLSNNGLKPVTIEVTVK